jgi:hypothetical protein
MLQVCNACVMGQAGRSRGVRRADAAPSIESVWVRPPSMAQACAAGTLSTASSSARTLRRRSFQFMGLE